MPFFSSLRFRLFTSALLIAAATGAIAQSPTIAFVPTISTYAGTGVQGNTNGALTAAQFGNPSFIAVSPSGDFYVADRNKSDIRRINFAAGMVSNFAGNSGTTCSADNLAPTATALHGPNVAVTDAAGNVFITDQSSNRIRKVDINGVVTTSVGSTACTAGFAGDGLAASGSGGSVLLSNPASVAFDGVGNMYIADTGNNRIREVFASTGIINTICGNGTASYTGDGGPALTATISGPKAVSVDARGDIFITDSGNNVIREITPDGNINTVAGNGTATTGGNYGDGGLATAATLNAPNYAAADEFGNLYISDLKNLAFRVVDARTGIIYSLAGTNGKSGNTGDTGLAPLALMGSGGGFGPSATTFYPNGDLYIADAGNFKIRKLTYGLQFPVTAVGSTSSTSTTVGIVATEATNLASFGLAHTLPADFSFAPVTNCALPGAVATDATCSSTLSFTPMAPGIRTTQVVAIDASGNQTFQGYVGVGTAPAISFTTGTLASFAGTGTAGSTGDGAAATAAELTAPNDVAIDYAGNVYITGTDNKVRYIDAKTGNISTLAGTGTAGSTGNGGTASAALLNDPDGLALDVTGNVYIADTANNAVRYINASTQTIDAVAGTVGILSTPKDVAIDFAQNLYIADTGNDVVRKLNLHTGVLSIVAGTLGTAGNTGNGSSATAALLSSPSGVTVDAAGNLYIADTGNNEIREVSATSGIISNVAGSGSAAYAGDGGLAKAASLSGPTRIAVDAGGDLYITDTGNNTIRFVSSASGVISTLAGSAVTTAFHGPHGLALDQFANVYIADAGNNRIALSNQQAPSLDFGKLDPGKTSASQTVVVTNFGNQPLTLAALMLSTGFTQTATGSSQCSATTTLAAGATCTVGIAFAPSSNGNFNGTLTLTDNALNTAGSTQSVTLTGVGNLVATASAIAVSSGNNQTAHPYGVFANPFVALVTDSGGNGVAGIAVTFTAPATGASGTFANGTNTVTVTSVAGGLATATPFTANSTNGPVSITATFSGASTPATFAETIAGLPAPAVTVSYLPAANPSTYGVSLTLTATLVPATVGAHTATGTVSFLDGSTTIGTGTVSNGVAQYTFIPGAGMHSFTASYGGDTNFASSTSASAATLTVNPLTVIAAGNSVSIPYGTSPTPTFTGTLQGVLAADQVNVTATFTASGVNALAAPNTYPFTAVLSGSAAGNYTIASTTGAAIITTAATNIALTASTTSVGVGTSVTFTASLTSTTTGIPTGNVSFFDNGTLLKTNPTGTQGNVNLNISTLTLGTHVITATYLGNTDFAPVTTSQGLTVTVAVPDFTFSFGNTTSVTLTQGDSASLNFNVAAAGGLTTPIVFSCSGLPSNSSCTFTPFSFTPSATTASTSGQLLIGTIGNSAANAVPPLPIRNTAAPVFALLLGSPLLLLVVRRRRTSLIKLLVLIACMAVLGGVSGCSAGSVQESKGAITPAGTYSITLTATSGQIVHTVPLQLVVKQY